MLRLVVLILLLANAVYFAWSQNLLASWGIAPTPQSEPHRMSQQIKPESLRILAPEEARRLDLAAAPRAGECLQAGPLDESQLAGLRQALQQWPAGSWSIETAVEPESRGLVLKLPAVDEALRARLEDLKAGLGGKTLRACR